MRQTEVKKIISETESGYDLVAEKFSRTRKFFWHGMEFISDYTKDGDKVLDYGCGNGRLLKLIGDKNIEYTGVDISQKLINIAKDRYEADNIKFQKISDSGSLPFSDDFFKVVYAIAVFHHLPSKKLRNEIAKEFYRITKPGGYIVVTVWNLWQKNYIKNIAKNWIGKLVGKSKLDWNDCYITFKNDRSETFHRYHRAFTQGELERLFEKSGFKAEKCEVTNGKNIVFVGKK